MYDFALKILIDAILMKCSDSSSSQILANFVEYIDELNSKEELRATIGETFEFIQYFFELKDLKEIVRNMWIQCISGKFVFS